MGRYLTIAIAAILALGIVSCSSEEPQESSNPTSTNMPVAKTPPDKTPATLKQPGNQPFTNPVVPAKPVTPVIPVASGTSKLIRPTNATERIVVVATGREDPFGEIIGPYNTGVLNSTVPTRPIPKLLPLPTATNNRTSAVAVRTQKRSEVISATNKNLGNQQKTKIKKTLIASTKTPTKVNPKPGLTPVLPKVLPQVVPNRALASVLPPPPQPELARAVIVSGVVLIGKEPQAIIKVPNEPTSRYVQAGQRLANGVLVKRIEMNAGSEPIVILEQYGIEVARMVGEGSVNEKQSPTASAGSPVSVIAPPQNLVPAGAT